MKTDVKWWMIIVLLVVIMFILVVNPVTETSMRTLDLDESNGVAGLEFTAPQLVDEDYVADEVFFTRIYGDVVVWNEYESGYNIVAHDFSNDTTFHITNTSSDDLFPDIWDDVVVWSHENVTNYDVYGMYLSNGTSFPIADSVDDEFGCAIWESYVVYLDFSDDTNFFMYDLESHTSTQVTFYTGEGIDEENFDFHDGKIVYIVDGDLAIHDIDANETTIIDDDTAYMPRIYENNVVYWDYIDGTNTVTYYSVEDERRYPLSDWVSAGWPSVYDDMCCVVAEQVDDDVESLGIISLDFEPLKESYQNLTNDTYYRYYTDISDKYITWVEDDYQYVYFIEYSEVEEIPEYQVGTIYNYEWLYTLGILFSILIGVVALELYDLNRKPPE